MYYATYKGIGNVDIAEFDSEQQRDDWVVFKDPLSIECGTTKENCTFKRKALDARVAKKRVLHMSQSSFIDIPGMRWYIC